MSELRWKDDEEIGLLQAIAPWDGSYWQIGRMQHWKSKPWFFSCRKAGELVWFRADFTSREEAKDECEALIRGIYTEDSAQFALF